ncbi:MAG: hypothetical protein ABW019_00510 [Chitinophagaceae bacterium]
MNKPVKYLLVLCLLSAQYVPAQDISQMVTQKPVRLSGGIDLRGIFYKANGIDPRRKPFSWIASGNVNIALYGFDIPLNFTISEQDRSFSQPFNQFGLSPRYKWLTLHGGYRNISFSPYTLDGHTMLGGGLELNPGKFHFGVMYGRLNRATTIDTSTGAIQPFSFSRKGLAMKIGYGDESSFITLSALRAKDDSASVEVDPLTKQTVTAAANTVASLAGRVQFFKKLFIEGDGGVSVYTNDIGNQQAVPDSNKWVEKANRIMPINATTEFYLAYRGAIGFMSQVFSLKLEYRYVDPQFRSMGVYYFNNDQESITVSPSLNLLKGRLRLNGSIGRQKDNVRSQKEATTTRTIGMANLGWDITSRLGIDASFANYASNSKPTVVLIQNKYLLAQNNNNFSVTPRYVYTTTRHAHVVLASYNRAMLTDENTDTKAFNAITTDIFFVNYTFSVLAQGLSLTAGFNQANNKLSVGKFTNTGVNSTIAKAWVKAKLNASLNGAYTISKSDAGKTNIMNLTLNTSYQPGLHHRVSLRYALLDNKPSFTGQPDFNEHTAELGYSFTF